jgi:antitoxin VbhA-like protein
LLSFPSCARRIPPPSQVFAVLGNAEWAEIVSDEELFSLPLEIQQAIANQRLEGLELPREVILDSLRQIRGEVSIDELIQKYKTRQALSYTYAAVRRFSQGTA